MVIIYCCNYSIIYSFYLLFTHYLNKIYYNDIFIELLCTLFSLLFLLFILSPSLIILLNLDSIIIPSFIIYSLGYQWAWTYSISYLNLVNYNQWNSFEHWRYSFVAASMIQFNNIFNINNSNCSTIFTAGYLSYKDHYAISSVAFLNDVSKINASFFMNYSYYFFNYFINKAINWIHNANTLIDAPTMLAYYDLYFWFNHFNNMLSLSMLIYSCFSFAAVSFSFSFYVLYYFVTHFNLSLIDSK